jgi:hypothetical protein
MHVASGVIQTSVCTHGVLRLCTIEITDLTDTVMLSMRKSIAASRLESRAPRAVLWPSDIVVRALH